MRTHEERATRKYLRNAVVDARRNEVPLVLIGSYARGTSTHELSDIDVLMVSEQMTEPAPDAIHIVSLSEEQLAERVSRGDDFAQWALRFGVPLTCRKTWTQLVTRLLNDAPWPSTARKLEQLSRRLAVAEDLLEMGDVDAAREESGSALNLVSRALLLHEGSFPLSSPELPMQLRHRGDGELANAIERFRSEGFTTKEDVARLLELIRQRSADLRESDSAGPG